MLKLERLGKKNMENVQKMNNKVSNIQIGMLLALICCSFYLGISDIILLRASENEVLIAMITGSILGLIPVLMYLKIN